MDDRTINRLVKLKKEIEQATLDKANAEGALKQSLDRLNSEFGCKSIEQAKKKLANMKKQQEELKEELEEALKELGDTYDF